jgi:uncharacterized protein (TIGR03032 family)
LRSVYTANFPALLRELGVSLAVTTYQAGKLVLVRADGDVLNTHFRGFDKPMGLAVDPAPGCSRLAIGTKTHVWAYHNSPAAARKLEPAGKHDACFLPRRAHVTGDVAIHEMAWAGDEVLFVNTRFSCLSTCGHTLDSFVPAWRPPFVTALAPEDRCHLNGLATVDGRPRFVTALGLTDTAGGWRANKKDGGVVLSVPEGEVVARGLSMPHSPRWDNGRLWLLESGTGSIGVVDRGRYEPLATLPGFTRGLTLYAGLAFVGLSKVRETAVFSGIPITSEQAVRACGVWVVECATGRTVAFLRFEEGVHEIFAVSVLPGVRFPELLNEDEPAIAETFVLPADWLSHVPERLRASQEPS